MMPKYDGKIYAELKKNTNRNSQHLPWTTLRNETTRIHTVCGVSNENETIKIRSPPKKNVKIERATLKIDALNRNNRKIVLENH